MHEKVFTFIGSARLGRLILPKLARIRLPLDHALLVRWVNIDWDKTFRLQDDQPTELIGNNCDCTL